jgi:small subunit ribosomal protein S27e
MSNLQLYAHEIGHQAAKVGGWSIEMRWELIPKPRSIFLRVKCLKCANEQIVFERTSSYVKCVVCDELLAQPAGGKAKIRGEVLQSLN